MKTVRYPDKWLRLIGTPVLAVVVGLLRAGKPFFKLVNTRTFYLDLAVDLLIVLMVWETNRYIIRALDKPYPWVSKWMERLGIQASLVIGISCTGVAAIQYLYKVVLFTPPDNFLFSSWIFYDLSLTVVLVVLLNLLYAAFYLFQYHQHVVYQLSRERDVALSIMEHVKLDQFYNENSEQLVNQFQKHLIVNYGPASVPVLTDDVAYIYKEGDACFLKTFDSKVYTSGSSLDSLESLLNPATFFRLNRQMLAHIRSIKRFRQDLNGKLNVEFAPDFGEEVFVSKKKAPQFREWLGKKI